VLVARHRLTAPETGVQPRTLARTDVPSPAQSRQDEALVEADPAIAPPATFVPWAWLDRAADPAAAPELASRAASDAPGEESIAESEVQRVAGTQAGDAGTSPSALAADAGAPAAESESEAAPGPAPPGESCGFITCAAGYGCCNPSCGVCVAPGDDCDPTPCGDRVQYPSSMVCGRATCSVDQVCCNPSCGTCVAPGESCDETPCDNAIQYPFSPICGRSTCSVGQVCCNWSCGICVNPGETCSQQPCR
jgi:hypothetical protein